MQLLTRRITVIWFILVAATLVGWVAGTGEFDARTASVVAIVVAFVKARFVALDFMEVGNAPLALRLAIEAWILAVGGALIVLTG